MSSHINFQDITGDKIEGVNRCPAIFIPKQFLDTALGHLEKVLASGLSGRLRPKDFKTGTQFDTTWRHMFKILLLGTPFQIQLMIKRTLLSMNIFLICGHKSLHRNLPVNEKSSIGQSFGYRLHIGLLWEYDHDPFQFV